MDEAPILSCLAHHLIFFRIILRFRHQRAGEEEEEEKEEASRTTSERKEYLTKRFGTKTV